MGKDVLQASGIAKSFLYPTKLQVLQDISLTVKRGQSVAIVGRSGEGKSTLLNILGTLEMPDRGTLTIAGHHVATHNPAKIRSKNIGFIFQSFHLLDHLTALQNILLPAKIARAATGKNSVKRQKAHELLKKVGLSERANQPCRLLSGGEKQRVAIARALINEPDLLLADEPTGNLDHTTSQDLQTLLLSFASEEEKGLIVVTHDKELAEKCDEIYQLTDGILVPVQKKRGKA